MPYVERSLTIVANKLPRALSVMENVWVPDFNEYTKLLYEFSPYTNLSAVKYMFLENSNGNNKGVLVKNSNSSYRSKNSGVKNTSI